MQFFFFQIYNGVVSSSSILICLIDTSLKPNNLKSYQMHCECTRFVARWKESETSIKVLLTPIRCPKLNRFRSAIFRTVNWHADRRHVNCILRFSFVWEKISMFFRKFIFLTFIFQIKFPGIAKNRQKINYW